MLHVQLVKKHYIVQAVNFAQFRHWKNTTTSTVKPKQKHRRDAKQRPHIYNIIWGSLSVEKELFENYYISFAKSYYNSILRDIDEIDVPDVMTLAYSLMGITNFVSLRAILEDMDESQVSEMIDNHLMPILEKGIYKKQ